MSFASDSFYLIFNFCGVGVELRASYMLGKPPTTKQHPSLLSIFLTFIHHVLCASALLAVWLAGVPRYRNSTFVYPFTSLFSVWLYHPLAIVDSGIVNTGMKDFT